MAKIGIICDREFLDPIDQRVYKSAVTMAEAGYEVEILTPHHTTQKTSINNIIIRCFSTKGPPGMVSFRLIKEALNGNYDLYYCHEFDPLLYGFLLKKLTRKPIIWDCHEYLIPMKRELQGNLAATFAGIVLEIVAPRLDHIITVDNDLGRQLSKYNKVTVLPNYPNLKYFDSSLNKNIKSKNEIIYVGSLTRKRGLKIMLQTMKLVREEKDIKLTIVGGFEDSELERWAMEYDKKHNLCTNWKGWVEYTQLAPLISKANLGLSLLQNDTGKIEDRYGRGFPTKVFEYLMMKTPLICHNNPDVEKILNLGKCGKCVDPSDIEEIANCIIQLFEDGKLEEMGENGRKFVIDKFTWERNETELVKIIKKLT